MSKNDTSMNKTKAGGQFPRSFHVLVKPAGAACNLACTYCYYLPKKDLLGQGRMSEEILEEYIRQNIAGQHFLLPRADIANKELGRGITGMGASVHEVAAYRTVPASEAIDQAKEMLVSGKIDVITFTSSSTVSNLMIAFGKEPPATNSAKVACIGPKTAETAAKAGLGVDILAREHTIPGLVAAIEEYFGKET